MAGDNMTIYIDIVLIENLIMNYIILFTTAVVLKIKVNHIRLILASLLGAGYSIIAYMGIIKVYSSIILKIILSVLIIYIAFNPQNIKKMCKDLLLFYLVSFVFGGAAFALIYIIKPQNILMKNGLFLGTYTLKTVMLGAVVAFCIIIGAFAIIKNKISKKDMFCEIEILINQKKIKTKAMIDTGNMLKEPITNVPVIVVEHILLYSCMPKEILNNLKEIMGGDFKNIPCDIQEKYISKLKLIPFSSLGKQNGMLIGIRPEYVKVITDEQEKINKNVIIGIYEKSLTKKGEYQALIGIELL
ncbi:MAG: sigma-E processing peptidase SpoIIGA [Clostridia bacterium]|nr:sigma-E processing peptidase SpoIIGA [Clostridia bacterium]